jgi:chemotaxis protein methyltransferase CheR
VSGEPQYWKHPGYAAIIARVAERAGLLTPTCLASAQEGIDRAMARAGLSDFDLYLARLAEDAAAMDDLLVELTIGETYFFRNPEHFDYLRRQVLPELTRRRGPQHVVRVWSAGCSSGEEAWSLAVALLLEGYRERMEVHATDISRAALARAREAHYGDWSMRSPQADLIRPYLESHDKRYAINPWLQTLVRFDYLNLAEGTWPSARTGIWGMDVIFCRNVLIYFNRPTIEAVARRFHETLAEGGVLITGPSDPPLAGLAPLEPVLTDWGILYRRPEAASRRAATTLATPMLVAPPLPPTPVTPPPAPPPPPVHAAPPPPPPAAPPPVTGLEEARAALAQGDWARSERLAREHPEDARATALRVRALANVDVQAAVRACAQAANLHPLDVELRYLEALLLLGQGRLPEAEKAARQTLYLEPSLAVGHLMLGHILRRQEDRAGARRAFRTAESLCATLPPEEPVPLADGERAGRLAQVARDEWSRLQALDEEEAH